MTIYPAIDIRGGKCVRLIEGDFARETVFDDDPWAAALRWQADGAEWLHIVDLDGARSGRPANWTAIQAIRNAVSIPVQVGGGLRNEQQIDNVLQSGIDRVILGTVALTDQPLVGRLCDRWGDRIAVGLDARNGLLATDGWLIQSQHTAVDAAIALRKLGVETFIVTDIHRDGGLHGPNIRQLRSMQSMLKFGVIASGGVSDLTDVRKLLNAGLSGAVIGRALYAGQISLAETITVARQEAVPAL